MSKFLNLQKWKNSRCHFSYWYSNIGHEVKINCLAPLSVSHTEYGLCHWCKCQGPVSGCFWSRVTGHYQDNNLTQQCLHQLINIIEWTRTMNILSIQCLNSSKSDQTTFFHTKMEWSICISVSKLLRLTTNSQSFVAIMQITSAVLLWEHGHLKT